MQIFYRLILSGLFFMAACSDKTVSNQPQIGENRITVYTSFYAMYDFAKKIGGERINLENLVPAGTEPHDWEPAPRDMAGLEKADILIINGAGMEGWLDKVISALRNKKLRVLETSKNITLAENLDKDADLKYDPHVWLNPKNAERQMEAIRDALIEANPENKTFYEINYLANAKKLDELDREFRAVLTPLKKREIIVAHRAYGYLCEAFGLKQIPVEGLTADSEPTPARMAEIVDFAKKNRVKVIFFEDLISPKIANALAKETGAVSKMLNPLEGLRDEELRAGKEYFSVMRENLEALKSALQ